MVTDRAVPMWPIGRVAPLFPVVAIGAAAGGAEITCAKVTAAELVHVRLTARTSRRHIRRPFGRAAGRAAPRTRA